MRAVAVALGAVVLVSGASSAFADCDDPFRAADEVLELHLRMGAATWDALVLDEPQGSGCDAQYPYHEVEFRCGDDEPWIRIGVRHKRGDQRGRDTDHKPPVKLDFNRFVQGQRWPAALGRIGYRKLSLNNGQADNPGGVLSALLSEHLAWRLMRREVGLAGGVAYAVMYVHLDDGAGETVEYHGIYILIEDIDRTAIRARFGADDGTLLKTTSGSCRDQVVFDDGAPNEATDLADQWRALDTGGSYDGGWLGETSRHIHLESALRQEAVRDVLANGRDTLFGTNYSNYFSFDPRIGMRYYLPWDLDDAFRIHPQTVPFDTPLDSSCSPIGDRTRCHPDIAPRYLEIACQLTNGTLDEDRLVAELEALDALVRPIVADEVAPVWAPHGLDPLDADTAGTYAAEYLRVRDWIQLRIPFIRSEIEAAGGSCARGCTEGSTEACTYVTCEGERRCEGGLWTPCRCPETDAGPVGGDGGSGAGTDAGIGNDLGGSCGCRATAEPDASFAAVLLGWLVAIRRRRGR